MKKNKNKIKKSLLTLVLCASTTTCCGINPDQHSINNNDNNKIEAKNRLITYTSKFLSGFMKAVKENKKKPPKKETLDERIKRLIQESNHRSVIKECENALKLCAQWQKKQPKSQLNRHIINRLGRLIKQKVIDQLENPRTASPLKITPEWFYEREKEIISKLPGNNHTLNSRVDSHDRDNEKIYGPNNE